MLVFNILFSVSFIVIILLLPQIKKIIKKKYDFNFSAHLTPIANNLKKDPTTQKQADKKTDTSQQITVNDDPKASNPPSQTLTPSTEKHPHNIQQRPPPAVTQTPLSDQISDTPLPAEKHSKAENTENTTPNQRSEEPYSSDIASSHPTTKITQPSSHHRPSKTHDTPKNTAINQLTLYILPANQPAKTTILQGRQIIDALLNQKNEGSIRYNREGHCFTHYTHYNIAIYHIYQATNPIHFPDEEDIPNITTTGLMFDIKFPVEGNMPDVYAYNNYFRKTATQVATLLDYHIYDERLREWTDSRLETTRKTLVQQNQKSLI